MSTEIVQRGTDAALDYAHAPLDSRERYIQRIAAAGALLPRAAVEGAGSWEEQLARTFYIAEIGAMMGIHPLEALGGIHLIEGRWTISAGLMSSLVRQAGHKVRVTESGSWKDGSYVATVTIVRHDDEDHPHVSMFGYEDAEMAGLLQKSNWKKYPKSMCSARAMSKACRAAAEDALGSARYTPEEAGAEVDADGEPVHYEATPTPAPQPQRAQQQQQQQQAPQPEPQQQSEAPPAAAATTGTGGVRAAADISDDEILSSIGVEVVQHAKSAWSSHAKNDAGALLGVWKSAKNAKIMQQPALKFDEIGRPAIWKRDPETGAPMPLGQMLRELGEQARAASEAAAQDADAEGPTAESDVADAQREADMQNGELPDDGEPAVEGELMDQDGEGDPSAS